MPKGKKKQTADAKLEKRAAKRVMKTERHAKKALKRQEAEIAAAAADPRLAGLIADVQSIKPKKTASGLVRPVPPPALLDLIHSFLKDYKYIKAAHGMRSDHQKRPGHNLELWMHRGEAFPSLMDLYAEWVLQNPSKINEELYDIGQAKRAVEKNAIKALKKERLRLNLEGPNGIQNVEQEPTAQQEDESDGSSSDSESTSDSDEGDAMSVNNKIQPVAVAKPLPAAAANPLKRKAVSSSSSSASSSGDSNSESEAEVRPKRPIVPAKKKAKIATPPPDSSSSSSESDSDSDSSSASTSSAGVVVSKPAAIAVPVTTSKIVQAKASSPDSSDSSSSSDSSDDSDDGNITATIPTTKIAEAASSDSSDSSSSSDSSDDSESEEITNSTPATKTKIVSAKASSSSSSDSSSESDSSDSSDEEANKVSTQPTSVSRTSSDSSATLAGITTQDLVAKSKTRATSSSSSSSDSSSSSSSDGEEEEEQTSKKTKAAKRSKDVLVYHEPLSETVMENDPLAVGPETTVEATASNSKKLKKQHIPFSRIPADVKVDDKFASNKYVPYDYANKAHENLIVTKGKGFTKAKNKGKRGSYRGGPIDTQGVRAIKFDD